MAQPEARGQKQAVFDVFYQEFSDAMVPNWRRVREIERHGCFVIPHDTVNGKTIFVRYRIISGKPC